MGRYKYIFGPVLSRRLGLSLGIDLIPFKTCSLNCVYCECGETTLLTDERKEYIKMDEVTGELSDILTGLPHLDYITFAGSGEPTLHNKIGQITEFLKRNYPNYKVALLTNGTLFTSNALIEEVKDIDLIIPSLDAVSEEVFQRINRPYTNLNIKNIIEGLINLRKLYKGQIYLEIFIIPCFNDNEEEIKRLSEAAKRIKPDKIQLNSLDRPPAVSGIKKAEYKDLLRIATFFEPIAEIIGRYENKNLVIDSIDIENLILETISRRPCTREELKTLLDIRRKEVDSVLDKLLKSNKIKIIKGPRGDYLSI